MKTLELSQIGPEVDALLQQARADDLLVRLEDGSEFLLVAIDDFDQEIARARSNPKLMALLETRARQVETLPLDVVKQQLGL